MHIGNLRFCSYTFPYFLPIVESISVAWKGFQVVILLVFKIIKSEEQHTYCIQPNWILRPIHTTQRLPKTLS